MAQEDSIAMWSIVNIRHVDWVFYNASGGTYVIGHGGGAYAQHTYCTDIPWSEAQPGDLAFYPEDEHIGL